MGDVGSYEQIRREEAGQLVCAQIAKQLTCQIFYEPQTSGDVESVLRDYALAISSVRPHDTRQDAVADSQAQAAEKSKMNGALLFAVVGGKLSEGE